MAKRKQRHEEHPDERWLITYADVLTLMFVLFMVLFSISVVNTAKFDMLKQTLQDAFNSGLAHGGKSVLDTNPGTPSPVVTTQLGQIAPEVPSVAGIGLKEGTVEQNLETSQLQAAEKAIKDKLDQSGMADKVNTTVNEKGLAIRLETDGVLFSPGSAVLRPEGQQIIGPIAASLRGLPNPVQITGHTDSTPIHTAQFPSNWELAAARAVAVLHSVNGDGVPDTRLQRTTYGDTQPIGDNESEAGRALNRRVEILVLRTQGSPGTTSGSATGG